MGSREQILAALRQAARPTGAPPEPDFGPLRFDDMLAAFEEQLSLAGGHCRSLPADADVAQALAGLPAVARAARLFSAVPGLDSSPPEASTDLQVAVLPGSVAVAENGAVWVAPADSMQRAALFLAEEVVLVVPRSGLVHTLHEAYQRIPLPFPSFGCFVSGPSKTADIEQALVIGAQGPGALLVLLVEESDGAGAPPAPGRP